VRRPWIALAALLGGVAGFGATFLIGIEASVSADCDGPCFDEWDVVLLLAGAIGAICALAFGVIARAILRRRSPID
jgi:hypothetical protein